MLSKTFHLRTPYLVSCSISSSLHQERRPPWWRKRFKNFGAAELSRFAVVLLWFSSKLITKVFISIMKAHIPFSFFSTKIHKPWFKFICYHPIRHRAAGLKDCKRFQIPTTHDTNISFQNSDKFVFSYTKPLFSSKKIKYSIFS